MNELFKKPEFLDEVERILEAAKRRELLLRIIGAIGVKLHCKKYGWLHIKLDRNLTDIDFAGYSHQSNGIRKLFLDLGYVERGMKNVLYSKERLIFYDDANQRHTDIFLDRLRFNHVVDFTNLESDYPTAPLAILLLEKLQIVRINKKDLIDLIMLLREHEIGIENKERINANYIADVCSNDWGFWKTINLNLQTIENFLNKIGDFTEADKEDVRSKILSIKNYIDKTPKTFKWKMRAKIGEKKKWYEEVEEISF